MNLGNNTVYIDGNLTVNGNVRAQYVGPVNSSLLVYGSSFNPYKNIFSTSDGFTGLTLGSGSDDPIPYLSDGHIYLFYAVVNGITYNFGAHYFYSSGYGFGELYIRDIMVRTSYDRDVALRFTYYSSQCHVQIWNVTNNTQFTSGTFYYKKIM